MNIYIGNLSYDITEGELKETFEKYGEVSNATLIIDNRTGRSKGFAFVEMNNDEQAKKAIEDLDGKELKGRNARVNEARPKSDKPREKRW